jgi:hypothetical protein
VPRIGMRGFGVFHRADFEGNHDAFDSPVWKDAVKKERTLNRLIGIIQSTAEVGFTVAVMKEDYDKVIPENIRDKFHLGKNHYTFAFRTIIGSIMKWRREQGVTQPMNYVFDRMSEGKGEIMAQFEIPIRVGEQGMKDLGTSRDCYSFADKAYVVPLQAADLCAWEAYRYMNTVVSIPPDKNKWPIRDSFRLLYRSPETSLKLVYHNKQSLANLVELVRAQEWTFGKMEQ